MCKQRLSAMTGHSWNINNIPSQAGKRVVITGTGGLGYETALALAGKGANVIIAGRNASKGMDAVGRIRARHPGSDVRFEALDLADLQSIQAFGRRYLQAHSTLDILVNNAGLMAPPQRGLTRDGFEIQFGTNYLGHFALTAGLLPALQGAQGARVVNVSSLMHRAGKIDFQDLQWSSRKYSPAASYAQSKLANLLFSFELQRRSDANNWQITSVASHPGYALTELIPNGPGTDRISFFFNEHLMQPLLSQSAADGALPSLYAATDPSAQPGGYYGPDGWFFELKGAPAPATIARRAEDREVARKLWEMSESLTGAVFTGAQGHANEPTATRRLDRGPRVLENGQRRPTQPDGSPR